ncbi:MAG: hypothetical protein M3464_13305 [Chloroflexota bacterium]|nr:hypothetical protein [Chloroflexota bacterium]
MRRDYWRGRYLAALNAAEARAADAAASSPWRLAFGFTNSIDRIISLDGRALGSLARREGAGLDTSPPDQPRTPAELLSSLLAYVRSGQGGEIWIAGPRLRNWITAHFEGRSQAGGTGARGANTLAKLGFTSILHVTTLPAEQAALIDNSGRVVIPRDSGLMIPRIAMRPNDPVREHFIFEFQAGMTVSLATETVVAPRANRVIVALDPVNFRHPIDPHFIDAVGDPTLRVRWALVSGYSQVADITMCNARIDETVTAIQRWRQKAAPPRIHLELAAMPDANVLAAVLDRLAPEVDSIGLNADELSSILSLQGNQTPAGAEALVNVLAKLRYRLRVPRLSLHTQHYCLSLTPENPITEQEALLYGSLVSGTFARRADFPSPADLRQTLALDGPCTSGLEFEATLARHQALTDGVSRQEDDWLVVVPTLAVSRPATTIGLGDSFTAGVLATL